MYATEGGSINGAFATEQFVSPSEPGKSWDIVASLGTLGESNSHRHRPHTTLLTRIATDYPSICSQLVSSKATFTIPSGSSLIELWGSAGPMNGAYSISVTPDPPYDGGEYRRTSFNSWEVHPALLYFAPLDPTKQYAVTLENMGRNMNCIHKVRVYSSVG